MAKLLETFRQTRERKKSVKTRLHVGEKQETSENGRTRYKPIKYNHPLAEKGGGGMSEKPFQFRVLQTEAKEQRNKNVGETIKKQRVGYRIRENFIIP